MKIEVYTYDDPKKWRAHSKYDDIKKAIHLCSTKNMAEGIKEAYQDQGTGDFMSVFTIREVMDVLLKEWDSPEEKLRQLLKLSRVIANLQIVNVELKEAFRKNKTDLLDTIRSLTYIGVSPNDLSYVDVLTEKERLFQEIWRAVEEVDDTYEQVREKVRQGWSDTELIRALEDISENGVQTDAFRLVLHGFYFVTPEQQVFLEGLKSTGADFLFFNLYDERFPTTFDFTRAFISERFGWEDDWKVENLRCDNVLGAGGALLAAYEGEKVEKEDSGRKIIRYESFFDFLDRVIVPLHPIGAHDEDKSQEDVPSSQIVATNADMLNEVLIQYYPEKFSKGRNFLSYPIGQFIGRIHQMKKKEGLVLDEEILISAFSSGWLYNPSSRKNARDYTHLLRKVLPFFKDCHLTEDWGKRFSELESLYDTVLARFEKPGDTRRLQSVRSPFTKISYLSLTRQELSDIRFFYEQLLFLSEELFVIEAEEARIGDHFSRLFELINVHGPNDAPDLLEEEREVLSYLNERLKQIEDDNFFLYEDVGEAINLYLSGSLEKDENPFIKPFIEIDGEAFKERDKVYLTGMDDRGLPLDEFDIPWPLQEGTFEELSERHTALELDLIRNRSVKQISRYLLYISLEFLPVANLEVSWMRNFLDREDLNQSVYTRQLKFRETTPSEEVATPITTRRQNAFDFTSLPEQPDSSVLEELTFFDFMVEYDQCPRRFYYSYILEKHPVFEDEFIHQFQFTDLLWVLKREPSLNDAQRLEAVGRLFPQWTNYKKQSIALKYKSFAKEITSEIEVERGVEISGGRVDFQLPGIKRETRKEWLELARANMRINLNELTRKLTTDEPFEAVPGSACKFCPHLDSCLEGEYGIDSKEGGR